MAEGEGLLSPPDHLTTHDIPAEGWVKDHAGADVYEPCDEVGDSRWVSGHFFYQASLDAVLEGLIPTVRSLRARGVVTRYFFLRHWQGGPHVRLRLLAATDEAASEVRRALEYRAADFFSSNPSADYLDPAGYRRAAELLARNERDVPLIGLQPNNSLQFRGYRPEHAKYGVGASLDAVEQHFERSSDLVLDLIGQGVSLGRRRSVAFAALLAAAAAGTSDLEEIAGRLQEGQGALARLSGWSPEDESRVEAIYDARGAKLRTVASTLCRGGGDSTGDDVLDGWRLAVNELSLSLGMLLPSPFDVTFAVDNCVHMLCNRLGIALSDEILVRALANRSIADLRLRRQADA